MKQNQSNAGTSSNFENMFTFLYEYNWMNNI